MRNADRGSVKNPDGALVRAPRLWVAIWIMATLLVAAGPWVYWSIEHGRAGRQAAADSNRLPSCRPGPWGELKISRIETQLPLDSIILSKYEDRNCRWVFPNYTMDQLQSLLRSTDLTGAQQDRLLQAARAEPSVSGLVLSPDDETVLAMSTGARGAIYTVLAGFAENAAQFDPFRYPADSVEEWLDEEEVAPATISLVRRLLYTRGQYVVFSDVSQVLNSLPAREDKVRLIRMVAQQSSVILRLQIHARSNVAALAQYWSGNGRIKNVQPLLESLAKAPGGGEIDIVHLLPVFARRRLYCYPEPAQQDIRFDCHWTSLNFWNVPPDNRYLDVANVREDLQTRYTPVTGDYRYGDVLLFLVGNNDAIHSAVYIAANIVFTKNGGSGESPWILMELDRLVEDYRSLHPDMRVQAVRLKG